MSSYPTALQQGTITSRVETDAERLPVRAERTDNQLVEMVVAGDEAAFEEIFERHKRLVAVVASRHFRRHEEVEEIVQIAFAKAFVEMSKFRGAYDRSFSSWLVTITSNTCLDLLRRQKVRPERLNCDLSEHESETLLNLVTDGSRHAEQTLADGDLAEKLLSHLNASDRDLLEMLYAQDLSVAEIAERQNCSKANIKVRAWRARGALRKILRKFV
ncbi:MAG: RNA polymerase sigma factor [Acidobacteria bacterium]|nr:RNA polymerase sigma factor [Acidobacteriota bacterium]